jgi:hypothetical protein
MDISLEYQIDRLYGSILENVIVGFDTFLAKDFTVLNEDISGREVVRQTLKKTREAFIQLIRKIEEYITLLMNKMKKTAASYNEKRILNSEDTLKSAQSANFSLESYTRLDRSIRINAHLGFQRMEEIVNSAVDVYRKGGSKVRGSIKFVLSSGTNPFGMLDNQEIRADLLKLVFSISVDKNSLGTASDVSDAVNQHMVGEPTSVLVSRIDIDKLLDNIRSISKNIDAINGQIKNVKALRERFEQAVSRIPSNSSIVFINSYVTTSLAEYLNILRIALNCVYKRYIKSVVVLNTVLNQYNEHSNNNN